jgi:hypothetical protein
MSMPAPPKQSFFPLFFVPGTIRLTPEGEQIVRQAAGIAATSKTSKIEVAVPIDTPGGTALREGRFTAIQNVLSASSVSPTLFQRVPLSEDAAKLPGAADRAEIRLLP